jgi:hypothetical protein
MRRLMVALAALLAAAAVAAPASASSGQPVVYPDGGGSCYYPGNCGFTCTAPYNGTWVHTDPGAWLCVVYPGDWYGIWWGPY